MPSPYLLHVNARPKPDESEEAFVKHVSAYLKSVTVRGAATRAALYRESFNHPLAAKTPFPRGYLLSIQTEHPQLLEAEQYRAIPETRDYWPAAEENRRVEQCDHRNYNVCQDYDPTKLGDEIAPGLLTVEIEPLDHDDLDKWYREEHLDMLAQLPDYRRSVRHTIGPKTDRTLQTAPMWLASHDFEFWDGFSMELGDAVSSTPWTLKVITSSPVFVLRSWELVYSVGFRNSST